MSRLRLAAIAVAAAAMTTGAAPSDAAQYEAVTERVVTAQGPLDAGERRPWVSVEAVVIDETRGGGITTPTHTSTSTACLTVDHPGTEQPTQTYCGPATIEISPTLDTARVSGIVDGISFALDVVANSTPGVSAEPHAAASSVTVSRVDTATATMVGGVIGDAEAQGSSWYAEVREKAKTTAKAQ